MIAVLMPTRNKPEEVERIIGEIERSYSRLYLYVADDDPKLAAYRNLSLPQWATMTIGKPLGFSRGINHLAEQAARCPEVKMLLRCEDDFWFREGWQNHYLDSMWSDDFGMCWCNYVLKGPEAEPHTAAIGIRWYRALGWFSQPTLRHHWCDNVLAELAHAVERSRYIAEPVIEHRHVATDPRKSGHGPDVYAADRKSYLNWASTQRQQDIQTLLHHRDSVTR